MNENTVMLGNIFKTQYFMPGVFNVFQAKDPQTDGEMEQGPPTIYIV